MGKLHTKKIQHKYFEDIFKNGKKFEIRKNDCDYQVGDFVILAEYDGEKPMNNSVLVEITYVLKDIPQYGLDKDYCIFGFVERWLSLEVLNTIFEIEYVNLPEFKKGTMFKGMDPTEVYTLEELGLE